MTRRLVPTVATMALTFSLAAQDLAQSAGLQSAVANTRSRIAVHSNDRGPGEVPYGVWAAGHTYKAGFHDGMTFIPLLGASYPHNQPWSWSTRSVRIGEHELLREGEKAERRDAAYRVEYRFAAFTEAYDVRDEGLEQTFVLTERPAGAGDLVIRGAVTTAMTAYAPTPAQQAIVFTDAEGRRLVSYGAATAFDADGDTFAMTTTFTHGEIRLTLPAHALAAADFPLTVDPLLTRELLVTTTTTWDTRPGEVAWADSATTAPFLRIDGNAASATDHDFQVAGAPAGLVGSTALFQEFGTDDSYHISAAWIAATDKWVVAWDAIDGLGTRRVRVHLHSTTDLNLRTNNLGLLRGAGTHTWRPDVGGTVSGTGNDALVVYQQDSPGGTFAETTTSTVHGLLFDTTTTAGRFGTAFQISSSGGFDAERPSVNKQGEGTDWFCVWQSYNNSIAGDDWDLIGRKINASGTMTMPNWVSDLAGGARHQLGPVVEGHSGRYAVLFSTCESAVGRTGTALGRDVRLEPLQWFSGDASPTAAGNRAPVTLRSNTNRALTATGLAFDRDTRSHWFAFLSETGVAIPSTWFYRSGYQGQVLEGAAIWNTAGQPSTDVPAVFDAASGSAVCLYHIDTGPTLRLYAQRAQHPNVVAASVDGSSCGTHTLAWAGPTTRPTANQLIGNELVWLHATSNGATDSHFVILATSTRNAPISHPLVQANCNLLVPSSGANYIGLLPVAVGATPRWNFALPESLGSLTVYFQDWVLHPATTTLTSSRRLNVPLVD